MKFSFSTALSFAAIALFSGVEALVPPPSDECITATDIPVTALPYSVNLTFTGYTFNIQDFNNTECPFVGRTIWWKFTPPTDGVLTVSTNDLRERFGPGLNLNIGTFTGGCGNIGQTQCGEDFFSASSIAQPVVRAGVTYFIEVGEIEGSTGDAQFRFMVRFETVNLTIRGDECTDAIVIPHASLPFNQMYDTRVYTTNTNDVDTSVDDEVVAGPLECAYGPEDNTIFFSYTPAMNGLMIISTSGSTSDAEGGELESTVTVFDSCNGPVLFCDEQDTTEVTHFPVRAGKSYTVRVGGYKFFVAGGLLNFTLSFQRNYFNLVNEREEKTIGVLNDLYNGLYPGGPPFPSNTINHANSLFDTTELSIEAIFPKPNNIKSVRIQLDNQRSFCENDYDEFKIYGELNDDDVPFAIGNRRVTATAYSRPFCWGNSVGQISQEFLVLGCRYIQYSLYDAQRDIYVSNVYNGTVISSPPCQANIGVTFSCGFEPKKVRIELRRASNNFLVVSRDEFFSPYLLFSDNGKGNILPGLIPAGEYTLTAIIDNIVHPSVRFTMGACRAVPVVDGTFDIDIRFAGDISFEQTKQFPNVVKRISSLIAADRPDFNNAGTLDRDFFCGDFPPRIDDLHICVEIQDFNDGVGGILGSLFLSNTRPNDNLPVSASISFDSVDFSYMVQTGKIESYVLMQLIQTLGLGGYWEQLGLSTSGSAPCSYNGTRAKAEFLALTGCSSNIPLEQNSVPNIDGFGELTSDCKFWDPACLKDEVLTYTLGSKKISRITLGALEDLGYAVNYAAADPYGPSDIGTCTGCNGNRNLKGTVLNKSKQSTCYSGSVHERAVHHGRKILRDVHEHHMEQIERSTTPDSIGNQRITVMYQHEDGTLCSVVVPADFLH